MQTMSEPAGYAPVHPSDHRGWDRCLVVDAIRGYTAEQYPVSLNKLNELKSAIVLKHQLIDYVPSLF